PMACVTKSSAENKMVARNVMIENEDCRICLAPNSCISANIRYGFAASNILKPFLFNALQKNAVVEG
ncbi:MAG TPA: hypothetical protein VFQ73_15360, partial [Flavisolibacter sp.]|nr:hypothetical protein [Flavisolibacter sp.]